MAKSKAKSNKGLKFLVVVLLVIVIAMSYVITSLVLKQWNFTKWGKGSAASGTPNTNAAVLAIGSDGEKLTDGSSYKMGRGLTYFTARDYSNNQEYAPSGEITLTATLSNGYIKNAPFEWSAKFADGKTAANYVSVTPDVTNSANATLRFLAPFDKQITVTAKLSGTSSADTCTVDCLKSTTITYPDMFSGIDDYIQYYARANFGVGTVTGDFVLRYFTIYITDDFIDAVKNYLKFDIEFQGFTTRNQAFERDDNDDLMQTPELGYVTYSMFIVGFDDYDEAHKNAINYAWNTAKKNDVQYNVTANIEIDYIFQGVTVDSLQEWDYTGSEKSMFQVIGDFQTEPDVNLNKNVTFGGK